jgi:hypothetical protein
MWRVTLELVMGLHTSFLALPAQCALSMTLLLAAAACGGADTAGTEQAAASVATPVITPLIQDDGSLTPSDIQAAAAWSRSGLYATAAQALQLVDALGEGVLQIRVECCGVDAVDQASGMAWGLQAAHSLPPDTPVLVSGLDLRLAAATANRLASGGLTHVWLVTP